MSLSRKAVLSVLLAMLCYACGYGIVSPSSHLCGSIFIYYMRALRIWLYAYLYVYNLTWGGLKMAKMGESQTGSVSFLSSCKVKLWYFGIAPLSLNCFGRFSLYSAFFIHSPMSDRSQPCQASNTHYTSTCFSNLCTRYNVYIQFVH